jgi:hypothetical protein
MKLNRKWALVSFGAALVVFVIVSFGVLLTWKVLRSPQRMTTIIAWMIAWPLLLLVKVVGISYPGHLGLVLAVVVGIATDVAILSGLVYAGLSLLKPKSHLTSSPPPPVSF